MYSGAQRLGDHLRTQTYAEDRETAVNRLLDILELAVKKWQIVIGGHRAAQKNESAGTAQIRLRIGIDVLVRNPVIGQNVR